MLHHWAEVPPTRHHKGARAEPLILLWHRSAASAHQIASCALWKRATPTASLSNASACKKNCVAGSIYNDCIHVICSYENSGAIFFHYTYRVYWYRVANKLAGGFFWRSEDFSHLLTVPWSWPLTPDLIKPFSSTQLLLAGDLFIYFWAILFKSHRLFCVKILLSQQLVEHSDQQSVWHQQEYNVTPLWCSHWTPARFQHPSCSHVIWSSC